jgi:aryl-alcohol dehydrogenase-like predicted oxidoreductase
MNLPKRPLGTTDMDVTRVGFGAWAVGGGGWAFAWGDQDDAESVAAMRHAAERGVNWIDTAAVYGNGHSEEVVARALREIPARERPYVFTKCGLIWDEKNPMVQAKRIGTAASLRRELEASLRRLGVERIDLYQMRRARCAPSASPITMSSSSSGPTASGTWTRCSRPFR